MNSPSNKRWRIWAFCAGLGFVSVFLFAASLTSFSGARAYVDQFSGDGSADPYTPELHERLQTASLVASGALLVLGLGVAWTFLRLKPNQSLGIGSPARGSVLQQFSWNAADLRQLASQSFIQCKWQLILTSLLFIIVHALHSQPAIRFDEAISWRDYSAKPIWITVAKYDTPNNHIFFNLLSGRLISVLGDHLYVLRMVSFLSGLLVVQLVVLCTTAISNRMAGPLAAVALILNPVFYEYSIYARGYALLTCLWLASTILLMIAIQRNNWLSLFLSAFFCALGFWTVPVMLYPFLATSLFVIAITLLQPSGRLAYLPKLASWFIASVLLAILFYTPVLLVSGHQSITSNRYVESLTIEDWLVGFPDWIFGCQLFLFNAESPFRLVCFTIPLCLCLVGAYWNRTYRIGFIALTVCVVGLLTLLAAQRVLPPPRTWVWVSVPLSIFLAIGWSETLTIMVGRMRPKSPEPNNSDLVKRGAFSNGPLIESVSAGVLVLFFTAPWSFDILSGKRLNNSLEGGRCDGAKAAAKFLSEKILPSEPIMAVCPASGTLDYYSKVFGLPSYHFNPPEMVWKSSEDQLRQSPPPSGILHSSESNDTLTSEAERSAIVAVVNNRAFDQQLEHVLAELMHTKPLLDWKFEILFQERDVTLYRVYFNESMVNESMRFSFGLDQQR